MQHMTVGDLKRVLDLMHDDALLVEFNVPAPGKTLYITRQDEALRFLTPPGRYLSKVPATYQGEANLWQIIDGASDMTFARVSEKVARAIIGKHNSIREDFGLGVCKYTFSFTLPLDPNA